MKHRFGTLALLGVLATPATAYFDNGNDWYARCQKQDNFSVAICITVVSAGFDMMLALGYTCGASREGVTREQLKDIVLKYVSDNPGSRHLPQSFLTIMALQEAFACRAPK